MDDKNIQVKVESETFDKFEQIISELRKDSPSITKKELMTRMIEEFDLERLKQAVPFLEQDLSLLQSYTSKINNLFKHVAEIVQTKSDDQKEQYRKDLDKKERHIQLLQQRLDDLGKERQNEEKRLKEYESDKKNVETKMIELQHQVEQLEASISDKAVLIQKYKEENDSLSLMLDKCKTAIEENESLRKSQITFEQKCLEIGNLEHKIIQLNKSHEHDITSIKELLNIEHQKKFFELQQSMIERERNILQLQTELQSKLSVLQENHSIKINEYEDKVKNLLEKLEESKLSPSSIIEESKLPPSSVIEAEK